MPEDMPYKRGSTYHTKRHFPGIEGKVRRTLGTESMTRARHLEQTILRLCKRGFTEPVEAWLADELSIHRLADAVEAGKLPALMRDLRSRSVPLSEGMDRALEWKAPDVKPRTLARYRESAAHVTRIGEGLSVREALGDEFRQRFKRERLKQGATKSTVNKDLQALSLLATYALQRGWIEKRPTIKRYSVADRMRYLEGDELTAFMAAVRRPFRMRFMLLVGTGMRLGETEAMRPTDVKFGEDECRILLPDAKSVAGVRPVFVPPWCADALREHMQSGHDPVFSIPRRTVQEEHSRACSIVGLKDYRLHDHRHTAAVHLARSGIPLHLLQQQLGHANIQQTMKYARFHPDYSDMGEYFDRVAGKLGLRGTSRGTPAGREESGAER